MIRLSKETVKRDHALFLSNFPEGTKLKLTCFHPLQCPIAITEAKTLDRTVQDYGIFSLFILRMYDAGIKQPQLIANISGMSVATVETYLEREKYVLQHIDAKTDELTELGYATLKENEDNEDEVKSHELFETVRRFHIDALTGTVIPSYLEYELSDNLKPDQELGDFILPRESAEADEDFIDELNDRLLEEMNENLSDYIDTDRIADGNVVDRITGLKTLRVFFRWCYLAKFEGMRYPMLVMSGRKTVDKVNMNSKDAKDIGEIVMVPLALGETDREYLEANGIFFNGVLTRSDFCFDYLAEACKRFELTLPDEDEPDEQEKTDDTNDHEEE